MTANGTATYTYDGENRMTAMNGGSTYTYDGDGNRVKKAGTNAKLYWRAGGMAAIAESDLNGNVSEEYIFFGGKRIARRDVNVTPQVVHYYFLDHLGSASAMSDSTGMQLQEQCDFYPFGGLAPSAACTGDPNTYKFTGKERDGESGMDEFGARYYAPSMGRFMIPDWAVKATSVPYANFGDPQSLNLYGYVGNNPLSRTDPDGHLDSPWHFGITLVAALNTGHSLCASVKLAWQATAVDFRRDSQAKDAANANMHAMAGKKPNGHYQSPAEARLGTSQTVANAVKAGHLGLPLHAVEDQATPAHDGNAWNGFKFDLTTMEHIFGDIFPSASTVKKAYSNAVGVLSPQPQGSSVLNVTQASSGPPAGSIGSQALDDPLDEYADAGSLGAGISFSRGVAHRD